MNPRTVSMFLLLAVTLFSCENELPRRTVPHAPVYFKIEMNGRDHTLKNALAHKIFTEKDRATDADRFGYSGILVQSNSTADALFAYDLCCPHEKRKDIVVIPTDDGKAACPRCGSTFVTMHGMGTPESGPATEPLQRYAASPRPNGVFIVHN